MFSAFRCRRKYSGLDGNRQFFSVSRSSAKQTFAATSVSAPSARVPASEWTVNWKVCVVWSPIFLMVKTQEKAENGHYFDNRFLNCPCRFTIMQTMVKIWVKPYNGSHQTRFQCYKDEKGNDYEKEDWCCAQGKVRRFIRKQYGRLLLSWQQLHKTCYRSGLYLDRYCGIRWLGCRRTVRSL